MFSGPGVPVLKLSHVPDAPDLILPSHFQFQHMPISIFIPAASVAHTEYDRLGFLLKLDSKLPVELATKYANFSEGACKPGYASALMTAIFPRAVATALAWTEKRKREILLTLCYLLAVDPTL
ncbi:CMP-N-acetylneuraminate-beta-1,4-galactoside alpha-2,3-sialyltransferase [Pteropus alecto]|uniref:CMP-N-acetylneuraminate-beta-1,4-galactoside alpha-2,3-sialyltransferase n=1 Tax=Pteropus alecto TaxID=9402 RepID=L5KQU4_PTEAL|nr:CMP-N-acetylneuraminate-beta-1,4-galactoside alpha-2,3-sialyltransferase [Pteropus alecto]